MHAIRARFHPSAELFLFIAYVVSGDTTHAKSTEIGWFSRRLQTTVLPELRKAHVPNKALARLQSPLPQVRATGLRLPRLRRADCAHQGNRRQSFELITWAPHKSGDAANNSSKTRPVCGPDGGSPVISFCFSCFDGSRALAQSGHNQRRNFGSKRQRALTAALRIAFRAPSDVGATSEMLSDSSRAPNRRKCHRFPDHRKKDQCGSTFQRFPRCPLCRQLPEDRTVPG